MNAVPTIPLEPYTWVGALREDHLHPGRPVILTGLAAHWPALRKWTPEFFRKEHGDLEVEVYDGSFQEPGPHYLRPRTRMRFAEYLDAIEAGPTDLRLFLSPLLSLAPELKEDVHLPAWVSPLSARFIFAFFGGEGATTTFHHDVDLPDVFHTVIHGEKVFHLYGPDQAPYLHAHPWTVRSYVDPSNPDHERFPLFRHARGIRCVVKAGQTLAIPSGWWHQVEYTGPSWGVAFRTHRPSRVPRALFNLTIQEWVDRLFTAVAPERWFAWKCRRAGEVL